MLYPIRGDSWSTVCCAYVRLIGQVGIYGHKLRPSSQLNIFGVDTAAVIARRAPFARGAERSALLAHKGVVVIDDVTTDEHANVPVLIVEMQVPQVSNRAVRK